MLKDGTFPQDLGAAYFDRRSPESKAKRLARQIAKLGYDVTLQPHTNAAWNAGTKTMKNQLHAP
jgi:transposase